MFAVRYEKTQSETDSYELSDTKHLEVIGGFSFLVIWNYEKTHKQPVQINFSNPPHTIASEYFFCDEPFLHKNGFSTPKFT